MESDGGTNRVDDGGGGAPVDGVEYPVVLGPSMLLDHEPGPSDEVFSTFRYDFQPASIDKSSPGLVSVDESKGVQVLLASSTGAAGGVLFKGKLVDNKDTDCLLLFDGTGFRLERCPFSCTQLRHVRSVTVNTKRKMDSAAIDQQVASGSSVKPGGSKKAKVTGRPRGRPPKAKTASVATTAKKPRAAHTTKTTTPTPVIVEAPGLQTAASALAPPPS